jgi:hypothetical protein
MTTISTRGCEGTGGGVEPPPAGVAIVQQKVVSFNAGSSVLELDFPFDVDVTVYKVAGRRSCQGCPGYESE